jgi:opacity protein-like surface antigen
MHAILGGAHEFPQTAAGSKNSLGVEMGGGADYHFAEHFSGRLEGNYVMTRFFGQTQSNFQLGAGVVFNF